MSPYPADVQQSFSLSPMSSPMQSTDQEQDPFAAFQAPTNAGPGMLQMPPMQNNGYEPAPPHALDDPWGSMIMGGVPPAASTPAPIIEPTPSPPVYNKDTPPVVESASVSSAESVGQNNYVVPPPVPTFIPPPPPAYAPPAPVEAAQVHENVPSTVMVNTNVNNAAPPSPISVQAPDMYVSPTTKQMPPEMPPQVPEQAPTHVPPVPVEGHVASLNNTASLCDSTFVPVGAQSVAPATSGASPFDIPSQAPPEMHPAPTLPAPQIAPPPVEAPPQMQPTAASNPFDFGPTAETPAPNSVLTNQIGNLSIQPTPEASSTTLPTSAPSYSVAPTFALVSAPSNAPPALHAAAPPAIIPPSSPTDAINASPHATLDSNGMAQQQAPSFPYVQGTVSPYALSPVSLQPNNADPFGCAFSPMTSPTEHETMQMASEMAGRMNAAGMPDMPNLGASAGDNEMKAKPFDGGMNQNNVHGGLVPSAAPNADPFGVFESVAPPSLAPAQGSRPAVSAGSPAAFQQTHQYEAPTSIPHPTAQNGIPPATDQNQFPAPSAPTTSDPFGCSAPNAAGAMVPSTSQNADPFGVFGNATPVPADPFAGSNFVDSNAVVPAAPAQDDPFGIFGAPTTVPEPQVQVPAPSAAALKNSVGQDDPWATAGFGQQGSSQSSVQSSASANKHDDYNRTKQEVPIDLDQNSLPKAGEYYDARVNSRSLGAMFYTARDLEDTLLYRMPTNVLGSLGSRPVVAYVAENSAAEHHGVHLGHCVLSVNGQEIKNPDECAVAIRNCPRPMTLRCYVMPDLVLTPAEGKHMVKYDSKDLDAPTSSVEWKQKYVVVGGIVAKPWMMMMYYNKRDYDTAVKETHTNYKCSVKVKQFDLRGARIILKGKDGKPNCIRYPSEGKPWYFISVLPNKGYPIKISSERLEDLEPVYAAIRRFIRKDMEARYRYEEQYGAYEGNYKRSTSSRKPYDEYR